MVNTARADWRRPLMGEHEIGLATLLFVLLGPPLAWTLHFLVSYFIVALFCTSGWSGVGMAVGVTTVLLTPVSAAAGVLAYRIWRQREYRGWRSSVAEPGGWARFFLIMGMLGAVMFTGLIVLEAIPPLFVPPCSEVVS